MEILTYEVLEDELQHNIYHDISLSMNWFLDNGHVSANVMSRLVKYG